jgi:hypothetical protein
MKSRDRFGLVSLAVGGVLVSVGLVGSGWAATGPVEVTTLGNGLAVYTCAGDYPEKYVSVRLVVDPPPALPGSRDYREFQTLAYSVFRADSAGDDLFKYLEERGCNADVWVEYREAVFEFDVFPEHLDTLFVRMARQWDKGLASAQVSLGSDGLEEAFSDICDPVIERLGCLARDGVLDGHYARDYNIPYLFTTRLRGHNMSLVLVGSKKNVDRALAAAKVLERIPVGQRALVSPLDAPPGFRLTVPAVTVVPPLLRSLAEVHATYEDLLRGDVEWDAEGPWAIALVINGARRAGDMGGGRDGDRSDGDGGEGKGADGCDEDNGDGLNPAETDFYYEALHNRLRDVVSFRYGSAYAVGGSVYLGATEHVMEFWPCVDKEIVRYDDLEKEMKAVAAELADSASLAWWRGYVEGQAHTESFYGLHAADPSTVADGLVELVTFARMQGREDIGSPYLPSAEEARRGFARMLESAEWFVMEPPAPSWGSAVYASVAGATGYVYGNLFGPDERTRALAVMCQCLLALLVLRRVEGRMKRARASDHQSVS